MVKGVDTIDMTVLETEKLSEDGSETVLKVRNKNEVKKDQL